MLRPMRLVDRWREIESSLGEDWDEAELSLPVSDESRADRAAQLLGPLQPGRRGNRFRLTVSRRGGGASTGALRRVLERLDEERIPGSLQLLTKLERDVVVTVARPGLAEEWDAQVAGLPRDWSDLHAELELTSTDHLDRGALLLAPLNPTRVGAKLVFRFRVARRYGYGASPGMARRCLERLDEEDIRGELRILRVLSDTRPVATQGPVWYVGGKAV